MKAKTKKILITVGAVVISAGAVSIAIWAYRAQKKSKVDSLIQHCMDDNIRPISEELNVENRSGSLQEDVARTLGEKGIPYEEIHTYPDTPPFSEKKCTTVEVKFDYDKVGNDNFFQRVEDALDPVLGDNRDWDGSTLAYSVVKDHSNEEGGSL